MLCVIYGRAWSALHLLQKKIYLRENKTLVKISFEPIVGKSAFNRKILYELYILNEERFLKDRNNLFRVSW